MVAKHEADPNQPPARKKDRQNRRVKAPWPDAQARQEMSEAQAASDNLGKHSKNPDWEKRW